MLKRNVPGLSPPDSVGLVALSCGYCPNDWALVSKCPKEISVFFGEQAFWFWKILNRGNVPMQVEPFRRSLYVESWKEAEKSDVEKIANFQCSCREAGVRIGSVRED
jgi:hypothetical protein